MSSIIHLSCRHLLSTLCLIRSVHGYLLRQFCTLELWCLIWEDLIHHVRLMCTWLLVLCCFFVVPYFGCLLVFLVRILGLLGWLLNLRWLDWFRFLLGNGNKLELCGRGSFMMKSLRIRKRLTISQKWFEGKLRWVIVIRCLKVWKSMMRKVVLIIRLLNLSWKINYDFLIFIPIAFFIIIFLPSSLFGLGKEKRLKLWFFLQWHFLCK